MDSIDSATLTTKPESGSLLPRVGSYRAARGDRFGAMAIEPSVG